MVKNKFYIAEYSCLDLRFNNKTSLAIGFETKVETIQHKSSENSFVLRISIELPDLRKCYYALDRPLLLQGL